MPLSPGAVGLPLAHLSARVPWHDTDWTGRVCAAPATNHACTVLKNIKERKDADAEERDNTVAWADLDEGRVPPCVFERGGFMRGRAFAIDREHRYAGGWTRSHAHFARTTHRMPAYSLEATPYRWMMRDQAPTIAGIWGIGYDRALEDAADGFIETSQPTTWVQDHRNQLALLDSFFSAFTPGKSLVLLYAKDVPLLEDRPPGARVLVGAGTIVDKGPVVEWEYSGPGPLRSWMWERAITHSIRPSFDDGFLLPYQQLLADPNLSGEDLSRYVAYAPPDSFEEFSYVSEHVGHDSAVAALVELARVVELLPGVADGPWEKVGTWISDRIADAWTLRGPYPGLGAALAAAGLPQGALIAHRVVDSLAEPGQDPWPALRQAIADAARNTGPAAGLIGRMGRKAWERLLADPQRLALLRMLARFALTSMQARRLFDRQQRAADGIQISDVDLLENPYLVYELDRGRLDATGFRTIDRGIFPRDAAARAVLDREPLPDQVEEAVDDRRVRAACTDILERAVGEGHALLDETQLHRRLAAMDLDPPCDPTSDLFDLAAEEFDPVLCPTPLAGEKGRGWQLDRLATAGDLIAAEVTARLDAGPIDVTWDWRAEIDSAINEPATIGGEDEQAAREEKAAALSALARARIAVLVGPAGTGKTTMLKALCSHPSTRGRVLLLAPTGKARVQLGDKVGQRALTLAQYLRPSGRWHKEFGYRVRPGAKKDGGHNTVVVDEASMLTEEMLSALLDGLYGVDRLVLCGDHRQLPPIGAGRPFADLVHYLRDLQEIRASRSDHSARPQESGGGLAELTIGRRQRSIGEPGNAGSDASRDDLAVASWFSIDGAHAAADEAMARVLSGHGDGTVTVVPWATEDDLHRSVVEYLAKDADLQLTPGDADALKRSLGASSTYNGRPAFVPGEGGVGAERWQLLTPVRSRPGGVAGLNRLVRRTWRPGDGSIARRSRKLPPPLGADEILFHDKVMVRENLPHDAERVRDSQKVRGEVANGEIGMAVWWAGNKGLKVELSTQPGLQFIFWASELNGDDERASEALELAYAVTVHKAQGSQFGTTLVVIPNPCPLLSPEMLYTALTRHRTSCVLFVQGDPVDLRRLAGPARSETARRLTRLFQPPEPFEAPDGTILDGSHIHRTANGELVISKSEVIVANVLRSLAVEYVYEQPLVMPDGSRRLPDFTIARLGKPTVYWEHLGMLARAGYRANWKAKRAWYESHGVLPWTEGGGPNGVLIWSVEGIDGSGINAEEIEQLAREVLGTPGAAQG